MLELALAFVDSIPAPVDDVPVKLVLAILADLPSLIGLIGLTAILGVISRGLISVIFVVLSTEIDVD